MCNNIEMHWETEEILPTRTVTHDDGTNIGSIISLPGITWKDQPFEGGLLAVPPKGENVYEPSQMPFKKYVIKGQIMFIFIALHQAQAYLEEVYKKNQAAA